MKINVGTYDDFKTLVNKLAAPDGVAYVADGTSVTCAMAVWKTLNLVVICGGVGNPINVTVATLTADYATAVLLTTSPAVVT